MAALNGLAGVARGLLQDLAAFALPQRCPGCGALSDRATLLCDECRERIPRLAAPLCARCLVRGREPSGCLRHPGFAVHVPWIYDERAALVVHSLKYGERPGLAAALGRLLAESVAPQPRADLVLEVPLHPARLRERGYNQAALLADALAEALAVPRVRRALERVRPTRPQARLGPAARRANVAGAFRVRIPAALAGRKILIVDDVLTTGATLDACLGALRDAGALATGVALAWAQ